MAWKLRVSSPTLEGVAESASEHFFSTVTTFPVKAGEWGIQNLTGPMERFRVVTKKGRYRLEEKMSD